ncbi:MAG: hypothetical protein JKP95_03630 [Oceanicaulis sp.]|nr:hypothetical protein [Oceanicaulis sp.]
MKVYVSAPDDIRLARRLLRDVNERGRTSHSVVHQYLRTVRPMHHEWTSPNKEYADILIRNDAAAARPADHLSSFSTPWLRPSSTRSKTSAKPEPDSFQLAKPACPHRRSRLVSAPSEAGFRLVPAPH